MNYFKNYLRVQARLTNPYQIKPEFAIFPPIDPKAQKFPPVSDIKVPAKLEAKTSLSADHNILRFNFTAKEHMDKCLGLTIGQYIWVEIDGEKRPYVPVSRIDEPGFVDILVRDMRGKNQNSFTHRLFSLQQHKPVLLSGPGTQFLYTGYGTLTLPTSPTPKKKHIKNIGIITHSSAITTTYSLIQSVMTNYDNQTGISLLWLGDSPEDFVFVQEFAAYVEQCKFNMNLMLCGRGPVQGWVGPYGRVLEHHVREYMPFVGSNQVIIMSGLEGELAGVVDLVKKIGYQDYMSF